MSKLAWGKDVPDNYDRKTQVALIRAALTGGKNPWRTSRQGKKKHKAMIKFWTLHNEWLVDSGLLKVDE